jgi:hypothetical protein
VLVDRVGVLRVEQLGDDRQAGRLARLGEDLERLGPRPLNANGEVRGLNAPPRSIAAPPALTDSATPSVCSRDSTVHGPAMSVNVLPPPTVRPAMSSTDGVSWLSSEEASLYGREIGTTRSTPAIPSRPSSRTPSGSPIAPMAVVSSPGITTT